MANLEPFDRVKETTAVVGTGAATLLGAPTGFQTFSVVGDGNTCYYLIVAQGGAKWEVGSGTYTSSGTTLSRTAGNVLAGSSGLGVLVSFDAGTKDVFLTCPAAILAYLTSGLVPAANLGLFNGTCNGRLTLTTGVPVTTADVASSTNVFFCPYLGNFVSVYNGTAWKGYTFAQLTLALGTVTSGANYDVFLWETGGVLALKLGPAWTSNTARGTGAGTTELNWQNNVLVNAVAITSGPGALAGRYLGTIRTISTTTTTDTVTQRYCWNRHSRVQRKLKKISGTSSWTYNSSATWRQVNGDAAMKVEVVVGFDEVMADLIVSLMSTDNAGSSIVPGIGVNSTTANSADAFQRGAAGGNQTMPRLARLLHHPSLGYTAYNWLEVLSGGSTVTTSFGGDGGSFASGLTGYIWG